jgi:hypothetical protein
MIDDLRKIAEQILNDPMACQEDLTAWIDKWGPFVEAAEKLAESIRLVDDRGGIVFDGAEAERLMKLHHACAAKEKP